MKKLLRLLSAVSLVSVACASSSSPASGPADPAATATPGEPAGEASAEPSAAAATAAASAAATSPTPAASGSASAAAAAGADAKDPNALVIEPAFLMKGGGKVDDATAAELLKAFQTRIATSTKMVATAPRGVSQPRRVTATFMIEKPTSDAKGLTIKMGLNGVEPVGKCPLFDLDQKLTMSGGKETAADVLELRKAAVTALLDKLEPTAPTLKPAANCTPFKKP